MGGRGSAFLNNYNTNDSSGVDQQILSDIMITMEDDEDTKLEHNGYTKLLKDKKIHIKQSTDTISEEIIIPNAEKIEQLTKKYKYTAKALDKSNQELRIRSATMPSSVKAMFVSNGTSFENLQLVYNGDLRYSNKEIIEKNTQKQIDIGHWVKSDKDQLVNHTVTHEYGHYVQRCLMYKDSQQKEGKQKLEKLLNEIENTKSHKKQKELVIKFSEDYATKYYKSIQKIARKEFGRDYEKQSISNYATTNNRETFAELFCSLNTNSNPDNDLVKAMDIYLKRRL